LAPAELDLAQARLIDPDSRRKLVLREVQSLPAASDVATKVHGDCRCPSMAFSNCIRLSTAGP
jgi:hypothetical protein